jgi:hypothetical protein
VRPPPPSTGPSGAGWSLKAIGPVCADSSRISLVEDEGVCLFDPTPTRTVNRYPFLREEMTEEEYVLVLAARQLVHVDHRI